MIVSLIAASFTFVATATGVEKGTPIEFLFAAKDTDRAYETMFLTDGTVSKFITELEKSGIPKGVPVSRSDCRLWPVGCRITIQPNLDKFIVTSMPVGLVKPDFIYTGGKRDNLGMPVADDEMPMSVFSLFSLTQSPIVPNGVFEQGEVYGSFTAATKLQKGERVEFTLSWDESTMPKQFKLTAKPGNGIELLNQIRSEAEKGDVDVTVDFDGTLTVYEAIKTANALAVIDTLKVKVNGCPKGKLFYRAFLPLTKWMDRKERITQPFELTIGKTNQLVYIDEDWSVEGDEPKLTPNIINPCDAAKYPKTNTCIIFANNTTLLSTIYEAMESIDSRYISNWYVFCQNNLSSHKRP